MLGGSRLKAAAVVCVLLATALSSPAMAQEDPVVTSTAPVDTTDAPTYPTDTPEVTTATPDQVVATDAPQVTTVVPDQQVTTTDAPEVTTAAPSDDGSDDASAYSSASGSSVSSSSGEAYAEKSADDTDQSIVKDKRWYWEHEDDPKFASETGKFFNFRPDDKTQTCSHDVHSTPFNKQVRGANLGGWLVLEPWITPTLFYQFLGTQERFGDQAPEKTAMDSYTFCTALGKEEANRQLRIHWANWVTEDDIREMAEAGVNSLRVPVGDWMFTPYEPYIGCTDGAVEELDRVVDLAAKYDIDILIDIHGLIGSQNGFDNSGKSAAVKWTSIASTQPVGTTTFEHWPIRMAEWAGTYDPENHNYSSINYQNLNQSLTAVTEIVTRYANHPAILGLQPVNEPWELTPIDVLKSYYWKAYKRVKVLAPNWKFVLHDSFRFGVQYWSKFMHGCPDIALDTHIYQAWINPGTQADFFSNACQQKYTISEMENSMMPVIVGEWSLGTDNCVMWLNGFNDNLPGFPKVICKLVDCPVDSTYLGKGFPGTPLDVTKPIQGPYGTGVSGPSFGKCPMTSDSAFNQKDDLEFTRNLNLKKLNAFALGHGWYFWNFKTEIGSKWNFLELIRQGAFPKNVSAYTEDDGVDSACEMEDKGEFLCRAKRGVKKYELENGLKYACNLNTVNCTDLDKRYPTLEEQCDWVFNEYWHLEREKGATCDFGGVAHLINVPTKLEQVKTKVKTKVKKIGNKIALATKNNTVAFITVGVVVAIVVGAIGTVFYRRHRRRNQYTPIGGRA